MINVKEQIYYFGSASPAVEIHRSDKRQKTVQIFLGLIASVITDTYYPDIVLNDGEKLRCRMTMSEFAALTGEDFRFLPITKGITVNAEYILEFEDNCCIMENSEKYSAKSGNCKTYAE